MGVFVAWLGVVQQFSQRATAPPLPAVRCCAALAEAHGRTPYAKSQNHLLTCKHDASASMICRMAELLQKVLTED